MNGTIGCPPKWLDCVRTQPLGMPSLACQSRLLTYISHLISCSFRWLQLTGLFPQFTWASSLPLNTLRYLDQVLSPWIGSCLRNKDTDSYVLWKHVFWMAHMWTHGDRLNEWPDPSHSPTKSIPSLYPDASWSVLELCRHFDSWHHSLQVLGRLTM